MSADINVSATIGTAKAGKMMTKQDRSEKITACSRSSLHINMLIRFSMGRLGSTLKMKLVSGRSMCGTRVYSVKHGA